VFREVIVLIARLETPAPSVVTVAWRQIRRALGCEVTRPTKSDHSGKRSLAMDSDQESLTQAQLRTPRAAAVAGILFSVLLFVAFGLMRISVRGDPFEPGTWLESSLTHVTLAMNLVPFAGIAFL
jgi:hypothetical protein